MKTIGLILVCCLISLMPVAISGCDFSETSAMTATNVAGTVAITAWFAIDDPGDAVKDKMQDVLGIIKSVTADGNSHLDSIYPIIENKIINDDKLTAPQKQLVLSGSVIILGALDEVFIQKPEIAEDRENVNKYITSFCNGCLTALKMNSDSSSVKNSRKVFRMRTRSRGVVGM